MLLLRFYGIKGVVYDLKRRSTRALRSTTCRHGEMRFVILDCRLLSGCILNDDVKHARMLGNAILACLGPDKIVDWLFGRCASA